MTGSAGGYAKFLPEGIPDWQAPFWESLRCHDVRVQRCVACGAYRYHPKEKCRLCPSREAEWASITGRGTVYSYTIIRRAPTPAYEPDAPYAIAHVTMDEGFRMIATVTGLPPEEVHIGMRVVLDYADVTPDWTLLTFRPA